MFKQRDIGGEEEEERQERARHRGCGTAEGALHERKQGEPPLCEQHRRKDGRALGGKQQECRKEQVVPGVRSELCGHQDELQEGSQAGKQKEKLTRGDLHFILLRSGPLKTAGRILSERSGLLTMLSLRSRGRMGEKGAMRGTPKFSVVTSSSRMSAVAKMIP